MNDYMIMKDITISSKQQKIELIWLVASFCVSCLLNVISIILYKTNWSEIYSQILWVLVITCAIYAVSVGIRITLYLIKRLL